MALDGGSIKDTEGRSQRFFSLRSMLFGLEKPMLEGSMNLKDIQSNLPYAHPLNMDTSISYQVNNNFQGVIIFVTTCVMLWKNISVRDSADRLDSFCLCVQWHWFSPRGLFFPKNCQRNKTDTCSNLKFDRNWNPIYHCPMKCHFLHFHSDEAAIPG